MHASWQEVMAHLSMIRVLRAEESLRHVTEIAAGNGLIKKAERDAIMSAWRRDSQRRPGKKKRLMLADLAAPGLPIVEVRRG